MPSDFTSFTLTNAVLAEFPHTSTSDVRGAIRRKCHKEQFFIELQYCLDMYNLKLFLFYCIYMVFYVCFFRRSFYLKTWLVHFMFCNAKTI